MAKADRATHRVASVQYPAAGIGGCVLEFVARLQSGYQYIDDDVDDLRKHR